MSLMPLKEAEMDLTPSASACAKLSAANVQMHATVDQIHMVLKVEVTTGLGTTNPWAHSRRLCFSDY